MPMPTVQILKFTREQLYERVWSLPATKLSAELGCSDVMLGKTCRSHDVPKPYLGYPHPLVAATRDALRRRKLSGSSVQAPLIGKYARETPRVLDVDVSPEATPRAVRILDALVRRIERLGGRVESRPQGWRDEHARPAGGSYGGAYYGSRYGGEAGTYVSLAGETVTRLRLRERRTREAVPPEQKEWKWAPDHRYVPNGLLLFDSGATWNSNGMLADKPNGKTRLEDGLDALVAGWIHEAGLRRIRRREAEEAERRRQEEARLQREREEELRRRREDLARRQAAEQARVDELLRRARAWREARLVREYLAAVAEAAVSGGVEPGEAAAMAEYLRWAREQADRLDPLTPSPPSVLDERV